MNSSDDNRRDDNKSDGHGTANTATDLAINPYWPSALVVPVIKNNLLIKKQIDAVPDVTPTLPPAGGILRKMSKALTHTLKRARRIAK
ncbi:hypothetical protein [Rheinheimera baltica]|uniref:hypothetical protein n=1 Tax=Rheinheimera baltica TaxID=67576 RepID=UPI00273D18DE|nr:hypothetical protein [Rheinheimera baltica]MDP5191378.1 hypothetical protein [Rheinheimera baltica]